MLVERFSDAQLPAAVRWQAVSFMRLEWPELFSGENRRSQHTCPPAAEPVHLAVRDGQVLVSYAVVTRQTGRHQGRELSVAGLGSVFTFPQYRREGWSRAVVTSATAEMAAEITAGNADLGLLFCAPALVPFYAACGWQRAGSTTSGPAEEPLEEGGVAMALPGPRGQGSSCAPLHVPHLW